MKTKQIAVRGSATDQERATLLIVLGACELVLSGLQPVLSMCDHVFHPDLGSLGETMAFDPATMQVLRAAMGIDDVAPTDPAAGLRAATQVKDAALRRLAGLAPRGEDYPFLLEVRDESADIPAQ